MNESINMKFTVGELNLILEGLGNLAYYRVHEVIHKIHGQAQEQVSGLAPTPEQAGNAAEQTSNTGNGVLAG